MTLFMLLVFNDKETKKITLGPNGEAFVNKDSTILFNSQLKIYNQDLRTLEGYIHMHVCT